MAKLSGQQAYLAMFPFLEAEYRLTSSGEIGGLLGSITTRWPTCWPCHQRAVERSSSRRIRR